jgi:hypothetical protein
MNQDRVSQRDKIAVLIGHIHTMYLTKPPGFQHAPVVLTVRADARQTIRPANTTSRVVKVREGFKINIKLIKSALKFAVNIDKFSSSTGLPTR